MSRSTDWQLAQKHELDIWEMTSKSTWRILSELFESSELQSFIESKLGDIAVDGKKILEIGIGPLGIGWMGLFGSKDKKFNIAIEPLPVLTVETGLFGLDDFIKGLQNRVTVISSKGEDLGFPRENFDIVVCNDVIDHVRDYQSVLKEAKKVLKKGGLFIFSVNVFSVFGKFKWNNYTRTRYADTANVLCHPHSFTYSTINKVLNTHGFRILHSNKADFPVLKKFFGKSKKARFLCTK
ncbi:MAG: methyltransferase domain-containing protein [Candidatus Omnitrophica bacterium]|nr:methyltransferase domain-containing protein [Candidatus Omnitrophota bacterium]